MDLIADRFVVRERDEGLDLASGAQAYVWRGLAGGPSEQLRWTLRCEWFAQVRHPSLAPLLDYGLLGETQRFEAWAGGGHTAASHDQAQRTLLQATRFLRACGRTTGDVLPGNLTQIGNRLVLLPPDDSGFPAEPSVTEEALPLDAHGVTLVGRRALRVLAEVIAQRATIRPQVIGLTGAHGAGVSTGVLTLARAARAHGFVPLLAGQSLDAAAMEALEGRSLLLITRGESPRAETFRALLHWTLRSNRPHILLAAGREAIHGDGVVTLERIPAEVLCQAIVPSPASEPVRLTIERAARRAAGLPGRFTRQLWPTESPAYSAPRRRPSLAAERPAPYLVAPDVGVASPSTIKSWPSAVDPTDSQRRLDVGLSQIRQGRHAAGARTVRVAVAGLIRRSAWARAAAGLLALARLQITRGQPNAARSSLHEAEVIAGRADDDLLLLDIAITGGTAWIDLARLDDAERTLAAAGTAAAAWKDGLRLVEASVALSRCLFWRGHYEDAAGCVERLDHTTLPLSARARLAAAASRAAVGQGDAARAIELATRALEAAAGEPTLVAVCGRTAAFAHLSVGDAAAVERDVVNARGACRVAHDPIGALKARLILAESRRRSGNSRYATALARRVRRAGSIVPPLLRARAAMLEELSARSARAPDVAAQHVARGGLAGLALFAAGARLPGHTDADLMADVLDILQSCQTADDERAVLEGVCVRLRVRLRAAAVCLLVSEGNAAVVVAADGRMDDRIARRVFDARQSIAPHRWEDAIEGGTPVLYGGETLGVIAARWPITAPPKAARVMAVLTMAASAVAPIAAAVQARRVQPPASEGDSLIGTSAGMEQVRRAVERAARAPFHVLIEGESGCGKELVARALHRRGPRRDRPFCTLNCAALPDELIEAELFGHARGAFTGASIERIGMFEEAHAGTLFLDEIGELSQRAQAKLLRVLQEGEVRRLGENVPRRIDVRVVAATNRNLRDEVALGRFRLDLLYRLDVVRISIPPLRERREDIPILAEHFWREAASRVGSRATLTAATVGALARHEWPGNVRELQNVLAGLAVRSPRRGPIPPDLLPAPFTTRAPGASCRLADARRLFEEQFVRSALVRTGGHRVRAARELGVSRQGLAKLMSRLQITAPASD